MKHTCPMFGVVLPKLRVMLQRDTVRNLGGWGVKQCCQDVFVEWDRLRLHTLVCKGVGS